ncbi:MAG: MFS transporter [Planctomycetaceae bacterium]|nr:MFS transporter [Planctomycetaceae bacterium]
MSNHVDHDLIENMPHLKPYYDDKALFYRNIFFIMVSNALFTFGFGATMSMMAMHMANVKLSASQISSIFAITGWIAIPTILYVSSLTDKCQWKWGRRLPFIAMAIPVLVTALFLFPYSNTFLTCLVLYVAFSLAAQTRSATYPFLNNDISKKKYWGRITGINDLFIGSVGGWMSIIVLLSLVSSRGEKTAFTLSALAIVIATVCLLIFIKEPPIRTDDKPNYNPISVIWGTLKFGFTEKKNIPIFLAYTLTMQVGIPGTFIALQAKVNLKMTEGDIGTQILQYGLIAMIAMSFFIGWSVDKLGTRKSLFIAYIGAVFAAVLGINPVFSADKLSVWLNMQISPVYLMAGAYIIGLVSYSLIGTAASIFIMSCVKREQFSRFCACSGSVNLFTQSFVTLIIGLFVTHLFGGNYGFSFLASIILGFAGIILFIVVDKRRVKSSIAMNNEILVSNKELVNG